MISPRGLADLSQPLEVGGFVLYKALDTSGLFIYVPDVLKLARRGSEVDFSLELVRGISPFLPPLPYGILDISFLPSRFSPEALAALRDIEPNAVVTPALFTRGYLRLQALAGNAPDDFETPVPLASNGLETVRLVRRLSSDGAILIKSYLEGGSLAFQVVAEMEISAVSPLLPGKVRFQAREVLTALESLADTQHRVTRDAVTRFWSQDPSDLPIQLEGVELKETQFAQVLADFTLADFAQFVPAGAEVKPTFELQTSEATHEVIWDLSKPKVVPKIAVLTLNSFEEARRVAESQGIGAVFHETTVPPLDVGFETILVSANLPPAVQGVQLLGVQLVAPARPPDRVHPLTAAKDFDQPSEIYRINWRFAPHEPVAFEYKTFVVSTASSRPFFSEPTRHVGTYLNLSVADFPLTFVPLSASETLLKEGTVQGVCRYKEAASGAGLETTFEISAAQPTLTLALPREAAGEASLELTVVSLDGGTRLSLDSLPARALKLDLPFLAEYGPHKVEVEVIFDEPLSLVALDLLPQDKLETPEHLSTLALTPERPISSWTYFAPSPFRSCYRYRRRDLNGVTGSWSADQLPFGRLVINASQLS